MERIEMIWNIATEIIMEDYSINYKKAQEIAERVLSRQERDGIEFEWNKKES